MNREGLSYFLLFSGAVFALYGATFGFAWSYDDFPVIVLNPDVRSFGGFLNNSYPGRPLRELSYLLDHALFGLQPSGWRIQHLLWHALNGFLLFQVIRRLGLSARAAVAAALLFLVHPLQVEVVANLSHRKDSLALAFCLLSLYAYIRSFAAVAGLRWKILALASWLVALAAKENSLVMPLLALLYEWQFLPRERRCLLRLPKAAILWPVGGLAAAAWWIYSQGGGAAYRLQAFVLLEKIEYPGEPSLELFFRALLKSWAFMATRIVWPQNLAVEYIFPVPATWADPWLIGGLLVPVGLIGLLMYGILRRNRQVVFWGGWMLIFWLPTCNLWPMVYFAADRYYYPFLAGLAVLLAGSLEAVASPGRSRGLMVAMALFIFGLATVSWSQVGYWRNDEALSRHALEVSPTSSALHNDLGKMAEDRGELELAMVYYRQAIIHSPRNGAAHFNLGQLYERSGRFSQALEHYRQFLKDDSPAYQDAARDLVARLRREYGMTLER